jgi:hypothetical protein
MTQPSGADGPGEGSQAQGARAETYLRLLAEAELRRALACPRSPVERIPPAAVLWAASAVGTVTGAADAAARSVGPAATRAGQLTAPWAASAMRFLAPPARRVERALPARVRRAGRAQVRQARRVAASLTPTARQAAATLAPPAARAGRALARAGWQARIAADGLGERLTRQGEHDKEAPLGLARLNAVGQVLVAAGVLGEPAARSVTDGFTRALVARGLVGAHALHWELDIDEAPAAPAGPVLAAPVGAHIDLAADGYRARMYLLALVLGAGEAVVTTVSWLIERPPRSSDDQAEPDWDGTLIDMVRNIKGQATDNRGGTYRLRADDGGGYEEGPWDARLELSPAPPAGLEWLDLTLPGHGPIRVDLTGATVLEGGAARPAASPARRAERIIDSASERLLERYDPESEPDANLDGIADLVGALSAAGALTPDSPAVARLVTLARRLERPVPAELADADAAGPAELPEAWLDMLARGVAGDGDGGPRADHVFVATAVAMLPEVDGTRSVICGLINAPGSETTTMMMAGWGWPWPGVTVHDLWQPFSCWARDDAGRWYRGGEGGYAEDGLTYFEIELSPPVRTDVTSLKITLTGLDGQATATVPVTWARLP